MKIQIQKLFLTLLLGNATPAVYAQGTAFTYNGRLTENGGVVNGNYEFIFSVYDVAANGVPVAGPLPPTPAAVANGLFTAAVDFGPGVFTGPPRFLAISVRPVGGGNFQLLSPRQELTSSPYAIHAASAGTAASVANGAVVKSLNNLHDQLTLAAGANMTITPNGNILTLAAAGVGGSGIWSVNGNNAYYNAGNVGIGTLTPQARLEIAGDWDGENGALSLSGDKPSIRLNGGAYASNQSWLMHVGTGGLFGFFLRTGPGAYQCVMGLHPNGNVGIGTTAPDVKLDIVAQDGLRITGYQPFLTLRDSNAGYARSRIQGVNGEIVLEPESFVNGSNPNASVVIANSGNVSLRTLTIRGGADVAEPFELTTADIAKGSVVVIDDEQAGKLKLSTRPYDTQVAGIVSGANGIDPGISLFQQGALEGGQNVALSGRVFVLTDAASGAIKPGDLLTTSGTPGHAMKVTDHARAQGAILGKAMSALTEGKGMVLVLVTLQ